MHTGSMRSMHAHAPRSYGSTRFANTRIAACVAASQRCTGGIGLRVAAWVVQPRIASATPIRDLQPFPSSPPAARTYVKQRAVVPSAPISDIIQHSAEVVETVNDEVELIPSWGDSEHWLNSMFYFQHLQAPTSQDDCGIYAGLLNKFTASLRKDWKNGLRESEFQALDCAVSTLHSGNHVVWYPTYGAALLMLPAPDYALELDITHLHLVCLDKWEHRVHARPGGAYEYTAHANSASAHYVDSISTSQQPQLRITLASVLQRARELKQKNEKGHTRTPDFFLAALQRALSCVAAGNSASVKAFGGNGGYTDVGPHTPSVQQRSTDWLRVSHTLKVLLQLGEGEQPPDSATTHHALLHRLAVLQFKAWLVSCYVPLLTPRDATAERVTAAMQMVEAVAREAASLADEAHDVPGVQAACEAAVCHIRQVTAQRAQLAADSHRLPSEPNMRQSAAESCAGEPPPAVEPRVPADGLDAARRRATDSLGTLPMPPATAPLAELHSALQSSPWKQAISAGSMVARMHYLRTIEHALFWRATHGFNADLQDAATLADLQETATLEALVDSYGTCMQSVLREPPEGCLTVELHSRWTLVGWCAYCLMHESACRAHPLLTSYGVALHWQDLRHLVLSSKHAEDAAQGVAAYLRHHTNTERAVFRLDDLGGADTTMQFAVAFAQQSSRLGELWEAEKAAAAKRRALHWVQIQSQQEQCRTLQRQLDATRQAVEVLEAKLSELEDDESEAQKKNTLQGQLKGQRKTVNRLGSELGTAKKPPPVVYQPVPSATDAALKWLFFLHMAEVAPDLTRLARMSFLAQELLIRPALLASETARSLVRHAGYKQSLVDHYNTRQSSEYLFNSTRRGADGGVRAMSDGTCPDAQHVHQGGTVLTYHCDSDGIWHPDTWNSALQWSALSGVSGLSTCNPFRALSDSIMVPAYTEALGKDREGPALQRYMECYPTQGVALDRSNWGIAGQDLRPEWLTKPGYLDFSRLRAYPLRQLTTLCVALRERSLTLEHPAVLALVRQALYHVGELTNEDVPQRAWRQGWDQAKQGGELHALHTELNLLCEHLRDTPREHKAVLLLGEMAAYLSQHDPRFRDIARQFSTMTARVADDISRPGAAHEALAKKMEGARRAKAVRWQGMALSCHGAGPLTQEDAACMVELMVLLQHGHVMNDDASSQRAINAAVSAAHVVMSSRVTEVVAAAVAHPDMLTRAVRRVLQQLNPSVQLPWNLCELPGGTTGTTSFEAVHGGQLYSVNVLDGTVLLDGMPPARLPKAITQHPLYVRTFGNINFEVVRSGTGVLTAIRPVQATSGAQGDRFYEFYLQDQRLVITEVDTSAPGSTGQQPLRLELLDAAAVSSWDPTLPPRLCELHSHWLCRAQGVLVLRPKHFQARDTHFLVRYGVPPAGSTVHPFDVRRVPLHLRSLHWTTLQAEHTAELCDHMLAPGPAQPVTAVLSKFEPAHFVHVHAVMTPDMAAHPHVSGTPVSGLGLCFELPRYGLEFQLLPGSGQVVSRDYAGYRLRSEQQLVWADGGYTLPGFTQYLVLERDPAAPLSVGSKRADMLVLVPSGEVTRASGAGQVHVKVSGDSAAQLKAHCYEVHGRLGDLRAATIPARLQLAALYAATASLLPEPHSHMTGAQIAVELVRQCWGNRPLSVEELGHVQSLGPLAGHLAPALPLLAHELRLSSLQLRHLHSPSASLDPLVNPDTALPQLPTPDIGTHYLQTVRETGGCWGITPHLLLQPSEEVRVLGRRTARVEQPACFRLGQVQRLNVPACPVSAGAVAKHEQRLAALVVAPKSRRGSLLGKRQQGSQAPGSLDQGRPPRAASTAYPLTPAQSDGEAPQPLHVAMHAELEQSWRVHHTTVSPTELTLDAVQHIQQTQAEVTTQRASVETHLLTYIAYTPDNLPGTSFRLHRLAGAVLTTSRKQLMHAFLQPRLLRAHNPFLSDKACTSLHQALSLWLQLCVLEDRCSRMLTSARGGVECLQDLVQELGVRRTWDPAQHPEWLVFEAEGQLQIRPRQYVLARHLMAHPGAVSQLNMGEGKTRVILPMLALHWAKGDCVVRLNLLSRLLNEAHHHLHTHLCASVLGRKIATLPFVRDVAITQAGAAAMRACLLHLMQEGGLLLVAPEWRLSLGLKMHELRAKAGQPGVDATLTTLQALASLPCCDILDESDELLSHKYQLIYAHGAHQMLPSRQERMACVQAVLRVVAQVPVAASLAGEQAFHLPYAAGVLEAPDKPGGWTGLRLLPGAVLGSQLRGLTQWLAERIVDADPYVVYELRWLRKRVDEGGSAARAAVLGCIKDASQPYDACLSAIHATPGHELTADQQDQLLMLRGLLAYGLLPHALCKRHQVDYGVSRAPTARKRLAVPFRAAKTPSERSEFAQPDVALLLTTLSYYYDGLSRAEFREALAVLLRMGANAQREHYSVWLGLSRTHIPDDEYQLMDSHIKIDATNAEQVERMYGYLSHNMAVVDFWLQYCVFPRDTQQYPTRLGCSAWHLADNPTGRVVGFSGTKDNHRLLPAQVTQHEPDPSETQDAVVTAGQTKTMGAVVGAAAAELRATDGKMLALLLRAPDCHTLTVEGDGDGLWQALIGHALSLQLQDGLAGVDALLDCGAMLASSPSNRAVGEYVLRHAPAGRYKGVCFYEESARQWMILDYSGRCVGRTMSPIAERDTFVIYDDARCRGADLQLRRTAVGLLTLGPGICKDKVMQAAGRLRQLDKGTQTLRFVGAPDVSNKVLQACGLPDSAAITAQHVLTWVMSNTVDATAKGVLEWAAQGTHFAYSRDAPDRVPRDELLELREFYADSRTQQDVSSVVERITTAARTKAHAHAAGLSDTAAHMLNLVRARGCEYGAGYRVVAGEHGAAGLADEECERELEQEDEEEEEMERQVDKRKPRAEHDYPASELLAAPSAESLASTPHIAPALLLEAVSSFLRPEGLAALPWSGRVWATANSLLTVDLTADDAWNEYLRPTDAVLLMRNGDALLLSEREANAVQAVLRAPGTRVRVALHSLSYLRHVHESGGGMRPLLACGPRAATPVPADQLASLLLYSGETVYDSPELYTAVQRLVQGKREEAEALVGLRGKLALLPHSHLEKACDL